MKLYLIRHGQTDYNRDFRWQGKVDVPLNSHGAQQARRIRQWLADAGVAFERVYASPLMRAVQTAKIIEPDHSIIEIDDRLSEIDLGAYDGRREQDIVGEIGQDEYDRWRSSHFIRPAPGGESILQVIARVRPLVDRLAARRRRAPAVGIVAHQGVLMAIKSAITGHVGADALRGYKQKNEDIDIWCAAAAKRVSLIELTDD